MSATPPRRAERTAWFALRKPLAPRQRLSLTAASFLLPLLLWIGVSYTPWIWHPDVKLSLSADREGVATVYSAGDRLSRDFYPGFVEAVRMENAALRSAAEAGEPVEGSKRDNLRRLRHLTAWGVANHFLPNTDSFTNAELWDLWKRAAEGELGHRLKLSEENQAVVAENWIHLRDLPEDFKTSDLPAVALLKLIPQGRLANPPYLPAPHDVILAGWDDLTAEPVNDAPSMRDRILHSVRIVFGGFLLAALFGVPMAVLAGTYDFFSRLFEPFIDFFRYLPAPTFSTLLVAIFGLYDAPKISLVFIGTFFQLVLVVANTTRGLDRSLIEAAQTLGARNRTLLFRVIVPGILPQLYNDLRILLGWAWTWLVIAELIGAKSGLTEFIETQGRFRNFDRVFPVIILIGVIGFLTDQLLSWLRTFLFSWTGETPGRGSRLVASAVTAGPRWFQTEVLDKRIDPYADRRR